MADTTANESITEIVATRLGEHLLSSISSLKDFYPEWPSPNIRLDLPAVTIFNPTPDFQNLSPYPKALPDLGAPVNSQSDIEWVVGLWNFSLQVDLWTKNKESRDDLFDQLFNALNPEIQPMGLRLTMPKYFNQICDYLYIGHTLGDSESASQTGEWRISLNVEASCKAIRLRKEFIIETFQTPAEIEADGQIDDTVKIPN